MDFIDKLEQFLLRPRAKVYYNTFSYASGLSSFNLGSYRGNYGPQDKDERVSGIVSMMKKLRDPQYLDPDYDFFCLDLIGWDYFDDILKLEPSNEDLCNLYQVLGYRDNTLCVFLDIIQDNEMRIKLFKLGQDYSYATQNKKLYDATQYLKGLSDEQWIEALGAYILNSPNVMEKEGVQTLIEVAISCIKDSEKCEKFIKDFFHQEVNLSRLFIEAKVYRLTIESTSIIKNFGFSDNNDIEICFLALVKLIDSHQDDFYGKIDFYQTSTEYNFVSDEKSFDTIKELINQLMPRFNAYINEDLKRAMFMKPQHIAEHFQDDFLTILRRQKLSSELPDKATITKVSKI